MKMPPKMAPGEGGACDGEAAPRVAEGVLGDKGLKPPTRSRPPLNHLLI